MRLNRHNSSTIRIPKNNKFSTVLNKWCIDDERAIALGSGTSEPIKMLVCANKINFDETSFSARIDDEQSKGKLRFASGLPCNFVDNKLMRQNKKFAL